MTNNAETLESWDVYKDLEYDRTVLAVDLYAALQQVCDDTDALVVDLDGYKWVQGRRGWEIEARDIYEVTDPRGAYYGRYLAYNAKSAISQMYDEYSRCVGMGDEFSAEKVL